jgi:sugar lactone lactonase YvrE
MSATASCIADCKNVLGEGPIWVEREQALYWVDIEGRRLFRYSEADGTVEYPVPLQLCSIAPAASGGFVGAGGDGFMRIALEPELSLRPFGHPQANVEGSRFNDGKVDREGRFWAGTMDRKERESFGALYRLAPDHSWSVVDEGYKVTNGPAFSVDGRTMYHNDSARQLVYAFDLAEDGAASNRRIFQRFGRGDGYPDGMTVDAEDCLWVAFWDGWCLRRFAPDGSCIATVEMPVQRPTSCAFGGPALDRLYVTSARRDLDEGDLDKQPEAGGLFVMEPGVRGVAELPFAG